MKKRLVALILVSTLLMLKIIVVANINSSEKTPLIHFSDCVIGLVASNAGGSDVVLLNTNTWSPTMLIEFADVTADNYVAISCDGKYIAYTTWDKHFARRYLKILDMVTGYETIYFDNIPARSEIKDISWMPDSKTLLFTINNTSEQAYQEIHSLNVEDGTETIIDKGEVWKVKTVENVGETADDFFLRGAHQYLSVKGKEIISHTGVNNSSTEEWNYFLLQDDIDKIYNFYGGSGSFNIDDIISYMYVEFSAPRCSSDGKSIIYSATLTRNSAYGEETPLWMASAIWKYDVLSGKKSIIYAQTDGGAIGRTDWVSDDSIAFVSYYDFQGSRDSINTFNIDTLAHRVIFPYSEEHYNNVTLIPIGENSIVFTSSAKGKAFQASEVIKLEIDSLNTAVLDVQFNGTKLLLSGFSYVKLITHEAKEGQGN